MWYKWHAYIEIILEFGTCGISSVSFLIYWESKFLGITMKKFIAMKSETNTEVYLDGFIFKNFRIISLNQELYILLCN